MKMASYWLTSTSDNFLACCTLPATKGLDNFEMVQAIVEGRLKALYLCGEEMSLVDANTHHVQEAFAKLDFMIVQDVFFSRTCQFADVVLPASPSLEKEGTFTSTERRIQRLYQVFEPLGDSRPDWRIVLPGILKCAVLFRVVKRF